MFSNLSASTHISFLFVFLEGLFSFLSPCILPLIPIYISYLAGNARHTQPDGTILYERKKVFFHTVCFTLGICCTFFLLGLSFTALGTFLNEHQLLLTRIGGIIIVLLGCFQLGIFNFRFLQQERKFHLDLSGKEVNPALAFVMGFTFSFAWTPCVGPALSSVLILASSSKNALQGNLLVAVYSLGFILPFLLLGLFTSQVLNFFKTKQKILRYTVKISGVLLILIGLMTFTGFMNSISGYLNRYAAGSTSAVSQKAETSAPSQTPADTDTPQTDSEKPADEKKEPAADALQDAFDFTLTDAQGNPHTLSDYKGKVVFLNFWATWCNPCLLEMPHIEELYKEYGLNEDEVVFLGVANPSTDEYPFNNDIPKDQVIQFIKDKGYTFPIVFDETGEVFRNYHIRSFPTTFMINKEGKVYGYVSGSLTKDIMKSIITETLESSDAGEAPPTP